MGLESHQEPYQMKFTSLVKDSEGLIKGNGKQLKGLKQESDSIELFKIF